MYLYFMHVLRYMSEYFIIFRFADRNSFEFEYGMRWKRLYEMYKEKKMLLESDLQAEMEQLEARFALVRHEHETEKLRRGKFLVYRMCQEQTSYILPSITLHSKAFCLSTPLSLVNFISTSLLFFRKLAVLFSFPLSAPEHFHNVSPLIN